MITDAFIAEVAAAVASAAPTGSRATPDPLRLASTVRRQLAADPADIAAALAQLDLRSRGRSKFGVDADRMWFTRPGLEQATRAGVATLRATRLAAALGTGAHVADLGAGLGGDAIALARAGLRVTAVELDPTTCAHLRANIAALVPGSEVSVVEGDATTLDRSAFDAVMCDPARRSGAGRVWNPRDFSPPWSFVLDLLSADAVVKCAPGLREVPPGVLAQWVDDDGDLVEAALWSGAARSWCPAERLATVLDGDGRVTELAGTADLAPARAVLGSHLVEASTAVIRAGLLGPLAARLDAWLPEARTGYLTCEAAPAPTPLARTWRIAETMPQKQVRRRLAELGCTDLQIKQRGFTVDVPALRQRWLPKPQGTVPRTVTLALVRVGAHSTVARLEPVTADPSPDPTR